jgi:hypothetical protein
MFAKLDEDRDNKVFGCIMSVYRIKFNRRREIIASNPLHDQHLMGIPYSGGCLPGY